jgi:hypothetical protein
VLRSDTLSFPAVERTSTPAPEGVLARSGVPSLNH